MKTPAPVSQTLKYFALAGLLLCGLSVRADITTGLVGYWNLANGPGSSTVNDTSGSGNTGTLKNFADTTFNNMWTGTSDPTNGWPYALAFNTNNTVLGTNTYVNLPDSTSLDLLSLNKTWTLSAWVYCSVAGASEPANAGIICKGDLNLEAYALYISGGKFTTIFHNAAGSGTESVTASTTIAANTWYHVVATVLVPRATGSLAEALIYVNGVLASATNANTYTTVYTNNLPVTIGCRANASGTINTPFEGIIDEVRIYDRPLPASDVFQLYTNKAFTILNNGIGSWNGLAGNSQLDTTSLNFSTNAYTSPLGTADSLADLLNVESTGSLPLGCYFNDNYYSNGVATAVTLTNVNIVSGGVAIGTASGVGTATFVNSGVRYTLNSTDGIGLTDGANKTALAQSGGGTTTLTGTNTFTGGVTVNAGVLLLGNGSGPCAAVLSGACPVTINGGTLEYDGNDSPTITNLITGAGQLAWGGADTFALSGANTYAGGTLITNGGTLNLSSIADTGSSPIGIGATGALTLGNGTLNWTGSSGGTPVTARPVILDGTTGTSNTINVPTGVNLTLNGQVKVGADSAIPILIKTGSGTLTLGGTANDNTSLTMAVKQGEVIITKASAATAHGLGSGASSVSSGAELQLAGSGGYDLYSGCSLTISNGGFFDLNGQSDSMSTLTLSGNGSGTGALINSSGASSALTNAGSGVVLAAGTTIGGSGNILLASAISGGFALTYAGTGELSLGGTNTYTGGTTVSSGTLDVSPTGFTPGNFTVNGGVLELDNAAAISSVAALTVTGSGAVNLNFPGAQTVAVLIIGSAAVTPGTWGAPGSGATYTSSVLTGSGFLNVSGEVYWDPGLSAVSPGSGGSGSWDNATADWFTGSSDAPWNANGIANFAGAAGTVTLNASQTADELAFTTPGYVINNTDGVSVLTLGGNNPVISIPAGTTTIGCALAGAGGLTCTGPGTLVLSGANTFAGTATVSGGTVSVNTVADSGTSALGFGTNLALLNGNLAFTGGSGLTARTLTLSGNTTATLTVPTGQTLEWDGQIHEVSDTAPQQLTFAGGGTLIMGGAMDNSGLDLAVNAGTVVINKTSIATAHGIGGGTSTVANGATLQLSGSGGYDIYGSAIVTVAGGGVLDLNGQTVNSMSTLTLSGGGIGGLGTLINSSYGASFLTNASGIVLAGNTTIGGNGPITIPAVISGNGMTLIQADAGLLTLGGANTFSGGLVISPNDSVQLNVAGGGGIGTIAIGASGTLIVNGAATYANAITGGSSSIIQVNLPAGNTFLTGSLSGFNGTVNVETATTTGQLVINNVNNADYPISSGATWNIANGATLDLATPVIVDAAQVIINGTGNSQAYGSLRLDACNQQGNVLLAGPNCLIGDGNTSGPSTISGVISDNGYGYGFTKVGFVVPLVLTAANTYSGPTIINFGTLALGPTGSIASSSAISLAAATAFDVSQVSGGYALGAGQSLTSVGGPATIVGSLNVSAGSPLTLACTNGAPELNITNGTFTLANNSITVTILGAGGPLPGTYPLITGLTGASPGTVTGSVASSSLTVNGLIANTTASLVFSNNTLYLLIVASSPTVISQLPATYGQPMSLYAGATPTFSVNAIGQAPLQYLWYTNSVLVGGATNSTITLTNVQIGPLTTHCIVSNSIGTATSLNWPATVLADPTAPYPASVMALNPIGYWRLNEGPDNGNGNQGVVCNDYVSGDVGAYTNTTLAQPGYNPATDPTETAAEFGETGISFYDSYAGQIAGIDFATPTNNSATFTIEAWVNGFTTQSAGAGIVTKGYGGGGEQFDLDYDGAYRFFVRDASGATHGPTSTNKVDGNWHHLAGVCDEVHSNVSLYVDGALAGSSAVTPGVGILEDPLPMCIGSRSSTANTNNNLQFFGSMNDVAIFNYALSASQIHAQYVSQIATPVLTQEPASTVTVNAGGTLVLPATAAGVAPLGYQWFDNNGGTNVAGGTTNANTLNATLTVSNVPAAWNNDTLQITVTNAYGSTNLAVTLNVISGLAVTLNPTNVVVSAGQSFTYTAQAAGSQPFYYHWYAGNLGAPIANATNAAYTAVTALGTNIYICQVSNAFGGLSVTNLTVTLTGVPYLALNGNGAGWSGQQTGVYTNTPAGFNNGVLTLTDGSASEARSFFFANPQYIGAFEASFTYQFAPGSSAVPADGVTFCLQNDPRGTAALALGGGDLGVGSTGAIAPSIELELDLYKSSAGGSGYSLDTDGAIGPNLQMGGVILTNGDPIGITVSYAQGQPLSLTFTDAVASASYSTNINVGNLTSLVGGSTAYVGFTGGDGSDDAVQTISNFQFISLMSLTAQASGTNMLVAWPSDASLYQLQSNTNLTGTNWVNVGGAVVQTNNLNQVTVPVSGASQFYRLQLQ